MYCNASIINGDNKVASQRHAFLGRVIVTAWVGFDWRASVSTSFQWRSELVVRRSSGITSRHKRYDLRRERKPADRKLVSN